MARMQAFCYFCNLKLHKVNLKTIKASVSGGSEQTLEVEVNKHLVRVCILKFDPKPRLRADVESCLPGLIILRRVFRKGSAPPAVVCTHHEIQRDMCPPVNRPRVPTVCLFSTEDTCSPAGWTNMLL